MTDLLKMWKIAVSTHLLANTHNFSAKFSKSSSGIVIHIQEICTPVVIETMVNNVKFSPKKSIKKKTQKNDAKYYFYLDLHFT